MKTEYEIESRGSQDGFNLCLRLIAGTFILFMLISLFYLYVAVGSSWSLVVDALIVG